MDDSLTGSSNTLAMADSAGGSPLPVQRTPSERRTTAALSDVNDDAFMEAATTRYYLQESDDSTQSSYCWGLLSRLFCCRETTDDPLNERLLETPATDSDSTSSGVVCCGFLCCDDRRSAPERHTLPRLSSSIVGFGRNALGVRRMSSPSSPVRGRSSSSLTDSLPLAATPQRTLSIDRNNGQIEVVRKIVMLGARNSGKSSVVHRIADKRFGTGYDPTIESTVRAKITVRGVTFLCDLLDTAGQDEYSNFSRQATVGVHGYCMVFSITSLQSFIAIQKIYERITELVGTLTVPIVLVGTKSDDELHREVSTKTGESLAESWGASYVECSAKSDYGIDDVFVTLLFEIERDSGLLDAKESEDIEKSVSKRSSYCNIS